MSRRLILWVMMIYLAVFPPFSYVLLTRSFDLMMQREYSRALSEEALIADSAWTQLQGARYDQYAGIQSSLRSHYRADALNPLQLYYNDRPLVDSMIEPGLVRRLLPSSGRTALLYNQGGRQTLYVAHRLSPAFALIYGSDVSPIYQQRSDLTRLFLIIFALGAGVVVALGWLFSRLTLRPVRQLTHATAKLAMGEEAPPLAVQRQDEIGQLARSFDQIAGAVREREQALAQEAGARQELIDALAHEMRTPLTTILGFVRLLETPELPADQRQQALERIASQTKRLATMDERLLSLTRMDHEGLRFECFSLLDCLREAAQGMEDVIVSGEDIMISADYELILMLAQNLITNAQRAGGPPPVEVAVKGPGFVVSDKGRGMSAQELARACEPFYRADSARSRAQGGAGLGLALVSKIVALHQGQMRIDSIPGQGTSVHIDLQACYDSVTRS